MRLSISTVARVCVILLCLPGCRWFATRHKAVMPHIAHERITGSHDLECSCMEYDPENLPGTIASIDGFRVLCLQLTNMGNAPYVFKPSYCSLKRASWSDIASLVHYDTATRVTWLSLPALWLLWEAIPLLIVPYGLYCSSSNQEASEWLRRHTLGPDDRFEIGPFESVTRFLFVPEYLDQQSFTITFFDTAAKNLLSFTIDFEHKS